MHRLMPSEMIAPHPPASAWEAVLAHSFAGQERSDFTARSFSFSCCVPSPFRLCYPEVRSLAGSRMSPHSSQPLLPKLSLSALCHAGKPAVLQTPLHCRASPPSWSVPSPSALPEQDLGSGAKRRTVPALLLSVTPRPCRAAQVAQAALVVVSSARSHEFLDSDPRWGPRPAAPLPPYPKTVAGPFGKAGNQHCTRNEGCACSWAGLRRYGSWWRNLACLGTGASQCSTWSWHVGLAGEKKAKTWCIHLSASDKDGQTCLRRARRPRQSWLGLPLASLLPRFLLNCSHWRLSYALSEEESSPVSVRLRSWTLV